MIVARAAFTTTPPAPVPAPGVELPPIRRAPSTLNVPSLEDASSAAAASLDHAASLAKLLHSALTVSTEEYARVVKRGFLDDAISYAQYAHALIDYDKNLDNDGFAGMIEGAVMEALKGARGFGVPSIVEPNLLVELDMARAAAEAAARQLALLGAKPGG